MATPVPDEVPPPSQEGAPLRSVSSPNFAQLLDQLGVSLVVSTYQTGKLVIARFEGDALNTHFLDFEKPMGLAADIGRLALGTESHIWEFGNVPKVVSKLDPPDRYDSCFLTRNVHATGNVDVHEMAWGGEDIWFINTRFSCLCTLDRKYSFIPRWRPPFVTALAPEDRCHLNGLAMMGEWPRFVTALGETDSKEGWRENKRDGGVLIDVQTGQVLLRGLSMPHSPRWYEDRIWLLESGHGSLAMFDPRARWYQRVAELPGFTRGLDFFGPLAFIGLSQVRESVFTGLPIVERLTDRFCGVWVVDIRDGHSVAYLRFEDAVREIFAVQVLPGLRFPEIIKDDEKLIGNTYVLPDAALSEVPGHMSA